MQMITERTDKQLTEEERKNLRDRLLRVPEDAEHVQVLMRAAAVLDGEIDYNELRVRYNTIPHCQRDNWINGVLCALNELDEADE